MPFSVVATELGYSNAPAFWRFKRA
ncbi:hypothetical protein BURKHO8Y_140321 [Burkholderia sp. 8Y]|nr:hypothetical protein BURKHO8Y_140321 [Burkholderia sp. 8Y]